MPIYEYICDKCQHLEELIQKVSDAPLTECPKCGGAMHRPVSKASFALKGSGWYKQGYSGASNTKGESSSASDNSSPKTTSTSTTNSDSKGTSSSSKD